MVRTALLAATVAAGLSSLTSAAELPSFSPSSVKGFFVEQFDQGLGRWSPSRATKEEKAGEVFSYVGQWATEEPTVFPGIEGDEGLVLKTKAAHHAISVPFDTPLDPKGKTLVVQYEVKLQKGLDCGGAYVKLLTQSDSGIQAAEFSDKTPYTIMFGPDRCGSTSKVHFIFRHTNPLNGEVEEKHLTAPPSPKIVKTTTLYTLIVRPDQTYEIKIDDKSVKAGSLLEDFSPAVNPPKEIDDATDKKPETWIDTPKMTDPTAVKPADWDEDAPRMIVDPEAVKPEGWLVDEPATIPDPEGEKPEEWSDEDDGEWIAPSVPNPKCEEAPGCGPWAQPEIPNPAYKGKWFAPLIDNPEYIGVWKPRTIPNPDYFEDKAPANFNPIAGLGFELWSMTEDILFDNIYIGDSEADAAAFAAETFHVKKPVEDAAEEAEKPKTPETPAGEAPDLASAPVEWLKFQARVFLQVFVEDPVAAVKSMPYHGSVAGGVLATFVGLFGVFLSMLFGAGASPKVQKAAKDAKEVVGKKAAEAKEKVEAATTATADKAADLKKRATSKAQE